MLIELLGELLVGQFVLSRGFCGRDIDRFFDRFFFWGILFCLSQVEVAVKESLIGGPALACLALGDFLEGLYLGVQREIILQLEEKVAVYLFIILMELA